MVKCCSVCGQEIRSDIDLGIRLSEGNKAIVNAVYKAGKHGLLSNRLFDKLYADDIDGGPLSGIKAMHTRICLLNRKIEKVGWCIRGEHTGNSHAYGRYFFQKFEKKK